ncbi:hypothetical protein AAMO2058_001557500 [Amorphochlora amoebiformis]
MYALMAVWALVLGPPLLVPVQCLQETVISPLGGSLAPPSPSRENFTLGGVSNASKATFADLTAKAGNSVGGKIGGRTGGGKEILRMKADGMSALKTVSAVLAYLVFTVLVIFLLVYATSSKDISQVRDISRNEKFEREGLESKGDQGDLASVDECSKLIKEVTGGKRHVDAEGVSAIFSNFSVAYNNFWFTTERFQEVWMEMEHPITDYYISGYKMFGCLGHQ